MPAQVALSALPIGSQAIVREYPKSSSAFLRLRELGLLPGVSVTLVRAAPLGDPLEIRIRTAHLSLRRSEADQIRVEPLP